MTCKTIASLADCIDSVLSVRDKAGLVLKECSIVNRKWSGKTVGDGRASDTVTKIYPSPGVKDLSHNIRLVEGGAVKQGDLFLIGISKNKYEDSDLRADTGKKNQERFIRVGEDLYTVISVKENYLTWDIQVRRLSSQENFSRVS
jgi:hypothetical protein